MTIQLNTTITDNKNCQTSKTCTDQDLKQKFMELFGQNNGDQCNVNWLDDGTVELQGASSMTLHTFALQAEAMGKKVQYRKKTIIEIV